jgi:hypothetical protein
MKQNESKETALHILCTNPKVTAEALERYLKCCPDAALIGDEVR